MNPFAFRPLQVSFWTTAIYLALVIPLIVINESVPPAPTDPTPLDGVNTTEAWLDLVTLTNGYHPYNSHKNDEVRNWLLLRIQDILDQNGVSWNTETSISKPPSLSSSGNGRRSIRTSSEEISEGEFSSSIHSASEYDVTVFNDMLSDVTCLYGGPTATIVRGVATYFEGTNIIVYIRGTLDEDGEWWKSANTDSPKPIGQGGVLVNAHYDSVSTGYGATDDGVGVVTVLQLIKYFTTPGNQPKHGIVALLNNAEEDYLYGARAFGKSPLMPFVHTFLNLEGAGAGGRAVLFRTTDQEVTAAYSKVKDPFGTVIGSDAFGLGFIRSQTDYVVFNGAFGARGMDIAFYRPRARYHTNQDDARHTSRASLWHMLSASITTVESLAGDMGNKFIGARGDGDDSKVPNGKSSHGVWFDLFGKGFVLFNLRGMFAWSLTLLIVTPLILILLTFFLHKYGKYYFFSARVNVSEPQDPETDEVEKVKIGGWKGFFRFPFAFVVAAALVFGAAFLLRKINPLIVYSSEYAVWAMMISLFYFVFWSIMKGADFARPSALHRGYVHIWLFIISWALLVAVTVFTDRFKIASGYFFVFFQSAVFLSTIITFAELFALPNMRTYGIRAQEEDEVRDNLQAVPTADALIAPSPGEIDPATARERDDDEEAEPASETTPLVGGRANGDNARTTFATTYRRSIAALTDVTRKNQDGDAPQPYDDEQAWSGNLPTWTWLLQLIILGPFTIILATQIGLLLLDSVNQTGPDGSNMLLPFLVTAAFSILLLLPITPFIHRITHHVPLFLLCIFVGTLIYNLVAFPFSADSRYKAYWQQLVDLDTGVSTIKFTGIEDYLRPIIAELPSAAGKKVTCRTSGNRIGVKECLYDGSDIPPNLAGDVTPGVPPQKSYGDLVSVNISHGSAPGTTSLDVTAKNTKACYLKFKKPVKSFLIKGGTDWDNRFGSFPEVGVNEILLWRRDWNKTWSVDIEWDVDAKAIIEGVEVEAEDEYIGSDELKARASGMEGEVACLWSDINTPGTIPALDEALKFAPTWVAISKSAAGLVEGSKSFII